MKLHLGCGDIHLDNFINIDLVKTKATDREMDVRKLKYKNNSVDLIYSAHVLEHFSQAQVVEVLKEWKRVLKRGGKIVAITPNINLHLRQLLWEKIKHLVFSGRYWHPSFILDGKWLKPKSDFRISNHLIADISGGALFPEHDKAQEAYHKVVYDPGSFKWLAQQAGFKKIKQINLNQYKELPLIGYPTNKLHYSSMAFQLTK